MESPLTSVGAGMTGTLIDLQPDWDVWHAAREAELATPHGWLSLVSLHWLTPDPTPVPGVAGRWSATTEGVVVRAADADGLVVRSVPESRRVHGCATLHPVDGQPGALVECGDLLVEVARRGDAHILRVRDPRAVTRTAFAGVPAYAADTAWVLDAVFQPYVEPRRVTVDAVVPGLSHFPTAVGDVLFDVNGLHQRLVALAGKDGGLALHFRDATSGGSTYAGGRILRVGDPTAAGELELDFNRTVNLPCAFTDFATCPLPPAGNTLTAGIEAGERSPLRPDHA